MKQHIRWIAALLLGERGAVGLAPLQGRRLEEEEDGDVQGDERQHDPRDRAPGAVVAEGERHQRAAPASGASGSSTTTVPATGFLIGRA